MLESDVDKRQIMTSKGDLRRWNKRQKSNPAVNV